MHAHHRVRGRVHCIPHRHVGQAVVQARRQILSLLSTAEHISARMALFLRDVGRFALRQNRLNRSLCAKVSTIIAHQQKGTPSRIFLRRLDRTPRLKLCLSFLISARLRGLSREVRLKLCRLYSSLGGQWQRRRARILLTEIL